MNIKTTIYDVVGYLIPGSILMFVFSAGYWRIMSPELEFDEIAMAYKTYLPNWENVFVFIIIAYVLGHFISVLSSLLIEKFLVKIKLCIFNKFKNSSKILKSELLNLFLNRFRKKVGYDYEEQDFRVCVCYVESMQPNIYSTAMILHSFSGMGRNLTLIFLCSAIWEVSFFYLFGSRLSFFFLILDLFFLAISFYHYLRFLRYFRQRIFIGFMLSENISF